MSVKQLSVNWTGDYLDSTPHKVVSMSNPPTLPGAMADIKQPLGYQGAAPDNGISSNKSSKPVEGSPITHCVLMASRLCNGDFGRLRIDGSGNTTFNNYETLIATDTPEEIVKSNTLRKKITASFRRDVMRQFEIKPYEKLPNNSGLDPAVVKALKNPSGGLSAFAKLLNSSSTEGKDLEPDVAGALKRVAESAVAHSDHEMRLVKGFAHYYAAVEMQSSGKGIINIPDNIPVQDLTLAGRMAVLGDTGNAIYSNVEGDDTYNVFLHCLTRASPILEFEDCDREVPWHGSFILPAESKAYVVSDGGLPSTVAPDAARLGDPASILAMLTQYAESLGIEWELEGANEKALTCGLKADYCDGETSGKIRLNKPSATIDLFPSFVTRQSNLYESYSPTGLPCLELFGLWVMGQLTNYVVYDSVDLVAGTNVMSRRQFQLWINASTAGGSTTRIRAANYMASRIDLCCTKLYTSCDMFWGASPAQLATAISSTILRGAFSTFVTATPDGTLSKSNKANYPSIADSRQNKSLKARGAKAMESAFRDFTSPFRYRGAAEALPLDDTGGLGRLFNSTVHKAFIGIEFLTKPLLRDLNDGWVVPTRADPLFEDDTIDFMKDVDSDSEPDEMDDDSEGWGDDVINVLSDFTYELDGRIHDRRVTPFNAFCKIKNPGGFDIEKKGVEEAEEGGEPTTLFKPSASLFGLTKMISLGKQLSRKAKRKQQEAEIHDATDDDIPELDYDGNEPLVENSDVPEKEDDEPLATIVPAVKDDQVLEERRKKKEKKKLIKSTAALAKLAKKKQALFKNAATLIKHGKSVKEADSLSGYTNVANEVSNLKKKVAKQSQKLEVASRLAYIEPKDRECQHMFIEWANMLRKDILSHLDDIEVWREIKPCKKCNSNQKHFQDTRKEIMAEWNGNTLFNDSPFRDIRVPNGRIRKDKSGNEHPDNDYVRPPPPEDYKELELWEKIYQISMRKMQLSRKPPFGANLAKWETVRREIAESRDRLLRENLSKHYLHNEMESAFGQEKIKDGYLPEPVEDLSMLLVQLRDLPVEKATADQLGTSAAGRTYINDLKISLRPQISDSSFRFIARRARTAEQVRINYSLFLQVVSYRYKHGRTDLVWDHDPSKELSNLYVSILMSTKESFLKVFPALKPKATENWR